MGSFWGHMGSPSHSPWGHMGSLTHPPDQQLRMNKNDGYETIGPNSHSCCRHIDDEEENRLKLMDVRHRGGIACIDTCDADEEEKVGQ